MGASKGYRTRPVVQCGDNELHVGEGKVIPSPKRLRAYYFPDEYIYPGKIIDMDFPRGYAQIKGVGG